MLSPTAIILLSAVEPSPRKINCPVCTLICRVKLHGLRQQVKINCARTAGLHGNLFNHLGNRGRANKVNLGTGVSRYSFRRLGCTQRSNVYIINLGACGRYSRAVVYLGRCKRLIGKRLGRRVRTKLLPAEGSVRMFVAASECGAPCTV